MIQIYTKSAYQDGYEEGTLVRMGYLQVSLYMLHSMNDFPLGSESQQRHQGYYDGMYGLTNKEVRR